MKQLLSANTDCQRKRILDYLTNNPGGASTFEIIDKLDCLRPAARVFELKARGHNIVSHWIIAHTKYGPHRISKYVLMPTV